MSKLCSHCQNVVTRNRHKKYAGRWKYCDDNKRLWSGTRCPDCTSCRRRKSIDEVKYKTQVKGRSAEWAVYKYLVDSGVDCEINKKVHGPDIVAGAERIEVKTVAEDKRWPGNFAASPIRESQKGYELIALVFPSGKIVIEKMSEWLNLKSNRMGNSYLKRAAI